jgi:hypothetical protein
MSPVKRSRHAEYTLDDFIQEQRQRDPDFQRIFDELQARRHARQRAQTKRKR